MKKRTIVILCIVGLILIWLVIFLNNLANNNLQAIKDDPRQYTNEISNEYSALFKDKEKIIVIGTTISNFRNPISDLFYDQKYCVEVYKIASSITSPVSAIIEESHLKAEVSYDIYYSGINNFKPFEVLYKPGNPGNFKKLYVNLFGNKTQTVTTNDSVVVYNSLFENFSLKIMPDGPDDMYVKPSKTKRIPFEVVFRKKSGNIYIILIAAKLYGAAIEPEAYSHILK